MKVKSLLIISLLSVSSLFAQDFIDYKQLANNLINENKKAGNYATDEEVKKALEAKDWLVVDVRTKEEWASSHIKGSARVGRQAPEKALELFVYDENENFVKKNLIVICNTAKRAAIEAETFKKMGFSQVKIYDIYSWIDNCNPVSTGYSSKKNKAGTKNKFGQFYAQHCKK